MSAPGIALFTTAAAKPTGLPAPSGEAKGGAKGSDARGQLARAKLRLHEPKPTKAGVELSPPVGEIEFQFNPKEVTIAKAAKWERKAAKGAKKAGPPEFKGADGCKLTLEMFFDATATHDGSVVAAVERLFGCLVPTDKTKDSKPLTLLVVFEWGKISSFPAYITQVSAKYTLFAADGTPIRATCSVALEEMPVDPPPKQNPTSGGLSARRAHTVIDGDSLASIAYREYGDAALWRPLAQFNGVDDPMALTSGQLLLMPTVEDLTAGQG